jgi:UDP-glucose 4-epimerase
MKKVIITGPTGCIGTALADLLLSEDCSVYAVCRPGSKNIRYLPSHPALHIIESDISELNGLAGKLDGDFDAFFHFAWGGTIGTERNNCARQMDNIQYTLDAVKLAKDIGCGVFIGAGSQAEYGHFSRPADDTLAAKPFTFYGAAKLSAGNMSRIYASQLGLRHVWVRIFSVYGPRDDENTLIYYILQELLKGNPPALTAGEQIWDYLYSEDAARALALLAKKGKDGETYCLGSGMAQPLRDYIREIGEIVNPGTGLLFGEKPYAENQVMYLCANIGKITQDTGFKPETGFRTGIIKTLEYIREGKERSE